MNLNKLIKDTLSGHGPIYPDSYEGDESKYLTFNYPDERGTVFGDNRPHRTILDVQIHLYLNDTEAYQKEKTQICRELKEAGFQWPSVTILLEQETGKRHIIFETQIKNTIEWEE